MNVVMDEDIVMLDDVVVIGAYGTAQKRSDMVGSAFQETLKGLRRCL